MIQLYWEIGKFILAQQEKEGWGTKVIDRLSKDLRSEFTDMKDLSARNLKYMRKFAEAYPNLEFVQTVSAQISWSHHVLLMNKVKVEDVRLWYIQKSAKSGWSYRVLMHQIDLKVHESYGKLPNNFDEHLPPLQSDLVKQILKDKYIFDFLAQGDVRSERDLEKGLTRYITEFLLALGKGFAFVGRQMPKDLAKDLPSKKELKQILEQIDIQTNGEKSP